MLPRAGRHQQQRVEDLGVEPGGVAERVVPPATASARRGRKAGSRAQMLAEVREAERDVPRLVLRGERATAAVTGSGA